MTVAIHEGDCLEVIPRLVAEGTTVDAVVTDPPYHLVATTKRFGARDAAPAQHGRDGAMARLSRGFMGQEWDGGDIAFRPETWRTVASILRPGGFALVFGGTRTHHRVWCAIEDAGLVLQDTIMWVFGSGFPKRKDMIKPSFEPVCVAYKPGRKRELQIDECRIGTELVKTQAKRPQDSPFASFGADQWSGCKESEEREGRWPANVCHDGSDEVMAAFAEFEASGQSGVITGREPSTSTRNVFGLYNKRSAAVPRNDSGSPARFFMSCPLTEEEKWNYEPANFAAACSNLSSEAAASVLSRAAARSTLGAALNFTNYRAHSTSVTASELESVCACVTGTIRCFAERFLRGQPPESTTMIVNPARCVATPEPTGITMITISLWTSDGYVDRATFSIMPPNTAHGDQACANRIWYSRKADADDRWKSRHPTVKPVSLIEWLVKLVCPPGGIFLDPFAGSGSAAAAAMNTGRNAILIEKSPEYCEDIRRRIETVRVEPPKGSNVKGVQLARPTVKLLDL